MNFRAFWIRFKNWEYWPFELIYLPIFAYWLWLSAKARSLLYFTASNPLMKNAGMLGESKTEIFHSLPSSKYPVTTYIESGTSFSDVTLKIKAYQLTFPVIAKPDIGERGVAVSKITATEELEAYNSTASYPYLIQDYIDLPLEVGVFYYRLPSDKKGTISSLVYKEMLSVTGNGVDSLRTLVYKKDRAFLQRKKLAIKFADTWNNVVPLGSKILLENIGNHCRGTKFLDGSAYITPKLVDQFDMLADELDGFNFGRFDIRTTSWEAMENGDFMILELNGAGSEPAHIYDPDVSITEAYRSLFHHWKILYRISRENHKNGIPYLSLTDGIREYQKVVQNKQHINSR